MMGTTRTGRRMRAPAVLVVAFLLMIGSPIVPRAAAAAAAAPVWTAVGSAEQVYVTGLPASSQASLISPGGQTVATRQATSLGGVLFREVAPGSGYRVRSASDGVTSGPLTVRSTDPVPWNPGVYNQSIP